MNRDDLARVADIRARADAATEGIWSIVGEYHAGHMIGATIRPEKRRDVAYIGADEDVAYCAATIRDAEFIAAARADVPWLLDRLAAETERADGLRARIEALCDEMFTEARAVWDDDAGDPFKATDIAKRAEKIRAALSPAEEPK